MHERLAAIPLHPNYQKHPLYRCVPETLHLPDRNLATLLFLSAKSYRF